MIRRDFMKSASDPGGCSPGPALLWERRPPRRRKKTSKPKYRAGVVGLGWTGVLYDVAKRDGSHRQGPWWDPAYKVEDTRRITPEVEVHRKFHHHDHPGNEGLPSSYAEALWDRPRGRAGGRGRAGCGPPENLRGSLRHRSPLYRRPGNV